MPSTNRERLQLLPIAKENFCKETLPSLAYLSQALFWPNLGRTSTRKRCLPERNDTVLWEAFACWPHVHILCHALSIYMFNPHVLSLDLDPTSIMGSGALMRTEDGKTSKRSPLDAVRRDRTFGRDKVATPDIQSNAEILNS